MAVAIRIGIIFLAFVSYVHLRKLCSSYFTISYLKQARQDFVKVAQFSADSELTCALRCNRINNCDQATFNRGSKKCVLFQNKDHGSSEPYKGDGNTGSRTVTVTKVREYSRQGFIIWRCSVTALNCTVPWETAREKGKHEALIWDINVSYAFC